MDSDFDDDLQNFPFSLAKNSGKETKNIMKMKTNPILQAAACYDGCARGAAHVKGKLLPHTCHLCRCFFFGYT